MKISSIIKKAGVVSAVSGLAVAMSCNSAQAPQQVSQPSAKSIVVYYSQNGATKSVALELQKQLGADIDSIVCENPYSGDFNQTIERSMKEMQSGELPKVKALGSDLQKYDTIYLGYPVWFGVSALPVQSFVKSVKLDGKVVITFCTFGSGGLNTSTDNLKGLAAGANFVQGYGVRDIRLAAAPKEIEYFLKSNGYVAGTVDKLPEYSDFVDVTDAEKAIFDAACADYKFPLGTPVKFGKRETAESVDYKFAAETKDQDGNVQKSEVFVTAPKADGSKPEFTSVMRF